ncbi:MAG: HNH endonuclease [Desulfomonilia bacterium]|jgi:hypothetical protein
MNYFSYNTDGGQRRFDVLIKKGLAATSGDEKFGKQLGKLNIDDILLMYEDGLGIVAIGEVQEEWDGKPYSKPIYYIPGKEFPEGANEYRIKVKWFLNISDSPLSVKELKERIGYIPRGAVTPFIKWRYEIEKIIAELRARNPETVQDAIDDLESHKREFKLLDKTEQESIIKSRIGQGIFREELIKIWGSCSVTGLTNLSLLRASHIKPWRECSNQERLDPMNGLLLHPTLDHLFDSGFVTFDADGKILISRKLSEKDVEILHIDQNSYLRIMPRRLKNYMQYHRKNVFKPG